MHTRQIAKYQQLQPEDRMTMASMQQQGRSVRAMALVLGRSPSTITRELERNTMADLPYGSHTAQVACVGRRAAARPLANWTSPALAGAWCARCWTGSGHRSRWPLPSSARSPTNLNATCPTRRSTRPSMPSRAESCANNWWPACAMAAAPECHAHAARTGPGRSLTWSASMYARPRRMTG